MHWIKKFVIPATLAVVVLLLGGFVYWYKTRNQTSVPTTIPKTAEPLYVATHPPKLNQIQVEYTDKGFVPATAQISKNDAIVWVNKSTIPMQLTFTNLPNFSMATASANYSYTFIDTGTFKYQNKLRTTDQATVLVTQ